MLMQILGVYVPLMNHWFVLNGSNAVGLTCFLDFGFLYQDRGKRGSGIPVSGPRCDEAPTES